MRSNTSFQVTSSSHCRAESPVCFGRQMVSVDSCDCHTAHLDHTDIHRWMVLEEFLKYLGRLSGAKSTLLFPQHACL